MTEAELRMRMSRLWASVAGQDETTAVSAITAVTWSIITESVLDERARCAKIARGWTGKGIEKSILKTPDQDVP